MPTSDFTGATLPAGTEPAPSWYLHLADYDETLAPTVTRSFADAAARDAALPTPAAGRMCRLLSPLSVQVFNGTVWETVWPSAVDAVESAASIRGVGALAAAPGAHKMLNLDGSVYVVGQPFGPGVPYRLDLRGGAQFYGNTTQSRAEITLLVREGGGWSEIFKRSTGDKAANSGDLDIVADTWLTATGSAALELDLIATVSGAAVNWYASTYTLMASRLR